MFETSLAGFLAINDVVGWESETGAAAQLHHLLFSRRDLTYVLSFIT